VPPDDPVKLSQGLQWMLEADLERLGAAARATALENSWESCADRYIALFQEVLEARRRTAPCARSRALPIAR
jgi:glycosyltransferase involved in cell wall biosynthesis